MAEWGGVDQAFTVAAYVLTWVVLIAYAAYLALRVRRAEEEYRVAVAEPRRNDHAQITSTEKMAEVEP